MSFFDQYSHQHSELPISLTPAECRGKTYIVTGSNTGIGFECAKHLVQFEAKHVILAVRSIEKGRVAQKQIEEATGRIGVVDVWECDLSSYKSIEAFAKRAESELERVDAIVENAGSVSGSWVLVEGLESTLTTNVVSTFLLLILMMPQLRRTAVQFSTQPRVVIVSSSLAFTREADLKKLGKGNVLKELSNSKVWGIDGADRYSLSKLLQMFIIREVAASAPASKTGVVVNYVCPGLAKTSLTRDSGLAVKIIVRTLHMLMGRSPEWSSRNLMYGIAAGAESHGKFIMYCELRENWLPKFITNASGKQWGEKIWKDLAAELERIQPGCVAKALKT